MWSKSMLCTGGRIGFLLVLLLCSARLAFSQFSSGSTGSDGALTYDVPGTYVFDPVVLGLDPAGDGIFNFTTITVAKGVTLQIPAIEFLGSKPVIWLASGRVVIDGTIEINGVDGNPPTSVPSQLSPAAGGAGGYAGGIGGNGTISPPASGSGVGGGVGPTGPGNSPGTNGEFTGNQFLLPLVGGAGGSGGFYGGPDGKFGGGGSGGGGALLIASSTSITYGGVINANGGKPGGLGTGYAGGAGSGGAIELIAPTVSDVDAGDSTCASGGQSHGTLWAGAYRGGSAGIVRIEATTTNVASACVGTGGGDPAGPAVLYTSSYLYVVLPIFVSHIEIYHINGIGVPSGDSSFPQIYPEFVFGSGGPVEVDVAAGYIPLGTIPKVYVTSLVTGATQIVPCSPLSGLLAVSTCSAMVTFPPGGSFGYVKAKWTQ